MTIDKRRFSVGAGHIVPTIPHYYDPLLGVYAPLPGVRQTPAPMERPKPNTQAAIIRTRIRAAQLNRVLEKGIQEGKAMTEQTTAPVPVRRDEEVPDETFSKFDMFIDALSSGKKELEDRIDGLMPRLQTAVQEGHRNIDGAEDHIRKVEQGVKNIEQFNQRMANVVTKPKPKPPASLIEDANRMDHEKQGD